MTEQKNRPLLCSIVSRQEDEKIIGSARDVRRFLFMELDKPWNESALETEHLPQPVRNAYRKACDNNTFEGKFLPIAPDPEYSREDHVRFLDYHRPDEPFATYRSRRYLIPNDKLKKAARILLVEPDRLDELSSFRENNPPQHEIMVCTHMERDPCCGHFGPPIHQALRTHFDTAEMRTWQVSHVGGHRYCPNLISLPDGRYWGRMEINQLDHFVNQTGDFNHLSGQYRGWAALSPPAQIVEKAAFEQEGWSWITFRKTASLSEVEDAEDRFHVSIHYRNDDESGTYEGIVQLAKPVRALKSECGSSTDEPAYKAAPQYELVELSHVS